MDDLHYQFPNQDVVVPEPDEDTPSLGLLIEGTNDTVDASAETPNDKEASHFDFCDTLPPHIASGSSSAGDVLKADSPFVPLKTGADVINLYKPKTRHISGETDDVVLSDKIQFKYSKRKASEAVLHFILPGGCTGVYGFSQEKYLSGKNVHPCTDLVDTKKAHGDVADSPTGSSSKPGRSKPQIHHCASIEEEYRYFMEHKERGCFVIFNQETFDMYNKRYPDEEPMKYRAGSDKDAFLLESAAISLGFEHVRIIHNATKFEIMQWIYTLSKSDHSSYDCFACAILTHGGNGDILYARDEKMKVTDFTRPFCADVCGTLAGKPKLFFIQACRGVRLDHGKSVRLRTGPFDAVDGPSPITDGPSKEHSVKEVTIPTEADFLIANSTVPDYYAWRNESNGSWFIQSLCAIFKRYGLRMELMQMMTRVNRMVAYQYKSSSNSSSSNGKKQIPSIATRLTAEVFFVPKEAKRQLQPQASYSERSPVPATAIPVAAQTRQATRYSAVDVVKKQPLIATTTSTPEVMYASGDYNVSPGLPQAENTFFPSPKNVARPSAVVTRAPITSPLKACPRSNFADIPEVATPLSSSTPKTPVTRLHSDAEAYSQSLGTHGFHGSNSIAAGMNQVSSTLGSPRLGRHRCSLPDNRRNSAVADEDFTRKAIKQTNV